MAFFRDRILGILCHRVFAQDIVDVVIEDWTIKIIFAIIVLICSLEHLGKVLLGPQFQEAEAIGFELRDQVHRGDGNRFFEGLVFFYAFNVFNTFLDSKIGFNNICFNFLGYWFF